VFQIVGAVWPSIGADAPRRASGGEVFGLIDYDSPRVRHEEARDPGSNTGAADIRTLQDHGVAVIPQDGWLAAGLTEALFLEGTVYELEDGDTVEHGNTSWGC
jgi:hypothetical protein